MGSLESQEHRHKLVPGGQGLRRDGEGAPFNGALAAFRNETYERVSFESDFAGLRGTRRRLAAYTESQQRRDWATPEDW